MVQGAFQEFTLVTHEVLGCVQNVVLCLPDNCVVFNLGFVLNENSGL